MKELKIRVFLVIIFLLIIATGFISLSNYKYYLPGDSTYHYQQTNQIIKTKEITQNNAIIEGAPSFYPNGYYVLMSSFSLITGVNLIKVFLFVPLLFYLFYFSVIYLFAKRLTKNSTIGILSAFSILFFWAGYPSYRIFNYLWATPRMLNPFMILLSITLLLLFNKRYNAPILLLIASIGLLHRSTSVVLFIFLVIFCLFSFIKKSKRVLSIIAIITLIISWSIWLVPYSLNYSVPFDSFNVQALPKENKLSTEDESNFIQNRFETAFNPFTNLFHLEDTHSILLIVWFLFSVLGLFLLFKKFRNENILLYFIILFLIVLINSLFLDITLIKDIVRTLLVPFIYCLSFGISIYYLLLKRLTKIKITSFVIISFIVITICFNTSANLYYERLDIPKYLKISPEAINYLQNTTENATIFADCWNSYVLSMLADRKVHVTQPGHIGPTFGINYSKRVNEVKTVLESCNINKTKVILEENKPSYVYIGWLENAHYKICEEKFEKYFEIKDFGKDQIYYLTRD